MENAFGQPQNVVVLGGSSDIARAITKKLCAARAHTVILAGRNQTLLDEAAREALDYGASKTDTVIFDAEDIDSARGAVASAFEKAGDHVDLVVMAVGLLGDQVRDQSDVGAAARMMKVNFTWPVAALTEVRNRLVAQGSGRILVMSSVGAVRVRSSAYLYGGAKAGLDRLCQGMADSLDGRVARERDWGTAAAVTAAVLAGAHIVRVHAVAEMAQVVRVAEEIRKAGNA